jgi:type IV pilus assembly protein PilM
MAFGLDSIRAALSGVSGASKPGSVLGVDIGTSSLKIVQLRPARGTAVLETYGEIALGPYLQLPVGKATKLPAERLAQAISDLSKEANVTASVAGVSIPFSSSLVSVIDMPEVDQEQLKRMIPIEARKYIPVPVSEVLLDWFVIPKDDQDDAFDKAVAQPTGIKKPGIEVLLVAIHNETLRLYQTVLKDAGLSTSFFEIEIFSTIRSSLGHGVAPVVVVDIGASTTKIYVVERGIIRVSHLFNIGGQHMSETLARSLNWSFEKAERVKREFGLNDSATYTREENALMHESLLSTLARLFSEVNRVLLSYGKRYNKNVSKVVLTGGGATLPGLAAIAKTQLSADVEIANPFAKTEAPAFLGEVLNEIGPGFAVAVGAALRKLKESDK